MSELRKASEVAGEVFGHTFTAKTLDAPAAVVTADRMAIVEWLRAELEAQQMMWRTAERNEDETADSDILHLRAGCHAGIKVALAKLIVLESAITKAAADGEGDQ